MQVVAGSSDGGSGSGQGRARAVGAAVQTVQARLVAAVEWLRWLGLGSGSSDGEGGETYEVNFQRPSPSSFYKLLGRRTATRHISL